MVSLEKYIHVSAISDIFHVLIFFKSFGFLLFFFFSFRRVFVWTNRYNSEGQLLGRIYRGVNEEFTGGGSLFLAILISVIKRFSE